VTDTLHLSNIVRLRTVEDSEDASMFAVHRRTMFVNVRCSPKMFACSGVFLTPPPPAEKASTRQDHTGQASTYDGAGDGQQSSNLATWEH
jgi:hypothetical protein